MQHTVSAQHSQNALTIYCISNSPVLSVYLDHDMILAFLHIIWKRFPESNLEIIQVSKRKWIYLFWIKKFVYQIDLKKQCTTLLLLSEWEFWRIEKEIGSLETLEII